MYRLQDDFSLVENKGIAHHFYKRNLPEYSFPTLCDLSTLAHGGEHLGWIGFPWAPLNVGLQTTTMVCTSWQGPQLLYRVGRHSIAGLSLQGTSCVLGPSLGALGPVTHILLKTSLSISSQEKPEVTSGQRCQ